MKKGPFFENDCPYDMPPRKVDTITKQPESLLEAMEMITVAARYSQLTDEFFKAVEVPTKYLSDRLGFNALQVVLLAMFIDQSENSRIDLSDIAEFIGCSTMRMLRLSKSLDDLVKRFYIKVRRGKNCDSYNVPREVIDAIRDDIPYERLPVEISTVADFFEHYKYLFGERYHEEISSDQFKQFCEEDLDQIADTHFARSLRSELKNIDDRMLFIRMAFLYVTDLDDHIGFSDIKDIYDGSQVPGVVKSELRTQGSALYAKLIENVNDDGMVDTEHFKLTDYAKYELLSELKIKHGKNNQHILTKHESLTPKELIYNAKEKAEIEKLTSLLMPEKFTEVQKSFENVGMRKGFCCLFYGAPGTGKTETVYQLARLTGRDIMQVNVDQIKSCWVGDSEKNIKNLFDRYRDICKDQQVAPILLFNEADAVLGTRMEGAVRSVEKMENSIQNIILQEMETLDGIMIATTNLTSNLDKAFERRFLYKIQYDKPTVEARAKIWMSMMKGLNYDDALNLAKRFDLSGGEIENIVRKHSVAAILSGEDLIDVESIAKMCEQERIYPTCARRVGF